MIDYLFVLLLRALGAALIWGPICALLIGLTWYGRRRWWTAPVIIIPSSLWVASAGEQPWQDKIDLAVAVALWIAIIALSLLWFVTKIKRKGAAPHV